jgi:hypothetical protein
MANAAGRRDASLHHVARHLRFGWWSLFVFASLGLTLELLHGFKAGFYLDVASQTRRLMWTLAHAHGVLLALLHVLYALALRGIPSLGAAHRGIISSSLIASSVLLPGGFFLGGVTFYAGDPGIGVLLVPPGAALLLLAVGLIAWSSAGAVSERDAQSPRGRGE